MKKRLCAIGLIPVLLLVLTSCRDTAEIPELLVPVSQSDSCYMVERGDIGTPEIQFATVVPTDYEHTYPMDVSIKRISVQVGDYVKKGDVLAYADVDEAEAAVSDMKRQLALENHMYEINQRISKLQIQKLNLSKGKSAQKQILMEKENARYDKKLHERRVADLKTSLGEQEKIVRDGTLRARHDGCVTYCKDLVERETADSGENIVIVSDKKDTYLELSGVSVADYENDKYQWKYVKSGQESIEVTEQPYTTDEMLLAAGRESYPCVRLKWKQNEEKKKFALGNRYPVYFFKKRVSDVLTVDKQSLYTEQEHSYVYVRGKNGEREKREITTGMADEHKVEVQSGLKEGEEVYSSYSHGIPSAKNSISVTTSSFSVTSASRGIKKADILSEICTSKWEGTISHVNVKVGDNVKKGDLLYVVNTGEGEAALTELSYQIQRENRSFEKREKQFKKQIKNEKGKSVYEYEILRQERKRERYQHKQTITELREKYQTLKSGNDGTGKIRVCAKRAGQVSSCEIIEGSQVIAGQTCMILQNQSEKIFMVEKTDTSTEEAVFGKWIAGTGAKITISCGGRFYEGSCVGGCEEEEKPPTYFLKIKDRSFEKKEWGTSTAVFSYITLSDTIVVPKDKVYEESAEDSLTGQSDEIYYYVWKETKDGFVKQYVKVNENLTDNKNCVILYGLKEGDRIC